MKHPGVTFTLLLAGLFLAAPSGPPQRRRRRNPAFQIRFQSLSALPSATPKAEEEAPAGPGAEGKARLSRTRKKKVLLPKPVLVYLSSPEPKAQKDQDYLRSLVFRDARVGLGSHFFLCLRGGVGEIPDDPAWKKILLKGKKFPRIVVVSRDFKVVVHLEGRIKSSNLLAAMKRVASWDYRSSFQHYISELRKTIIQLDALKKTYAWMEKVQHSGREFKKPQLLRLRKSQKKVAETIRKLQEKERKLRALKLKKKAG